MTVIRGCPIGWRERNIRSHHCASLRPGMTKSFRLDDGPNEQKSASSAVEIPLKPKAGLNGAPSLRCRWKQAADGKVGPPFGTHEEAATASAFVTWRRRDGANSLRAQSQAHFRNCMQIDFPIWNAAL